MMTTIRSFILTAIGSAGFTAQAVEANFQASFLTYGEPAAPPTVAYSVPAGQNYSYYTSTEVADDVTLSGTNRVIAGVNFEYYANYARSSGLVFRMYERAESGDPGNLIYSLPLDILEGGGVVNIAFNYDATNVLPQRFFYSVQFAGVEQGRVAGMIIPDQQATTGYSSDQILEKRGSSWLPIDLGTEHGRRVGLHHVGNLLILVIVDTPRTTVTVESIGLLAEEWVRVGEVETDDNGDALFEDPIDGRDQVYYRTVTP